MLPSICSTGHPCRHEHIQHNIRNDGLIRVISGECRNATESPHWQVKIYSYCGPLSQLSVLPRLLSRIESVVSKRCFRGDRANQGHIEALFRPVQKRDGLEMEFLATCVSSVLTCTRQLPQHDDTKRMPRW